MATVTQSLGFILLALLCGDALAADAPTTMPSVPALSTENPPEPFVVDGVCRSSATDGFAFHVAADGQRQVCVIFDPHDGTPIFLSDGQQTLVYDLSKGRVVRVPTSRAYVGVEWKDGEAKPLGFSLGANFENDAQKLAKTVSSFGIDRFLVAAKGSLKAIDSGDDTQLFDSERADGAVETIRVPRGKPDWYHFTSRRTDDGFCRLEINARFGAKVPDDAFLFPDLKSLGKDFDVVDLDERALPAFVQLLKSGQASIAKIVLASGAEFRESADKVLGSPDWDELRERDRSLGEQYRAALAKHGLKYHVVADASTTQASH